MLGGFRHGIHVRKETGAELLLMRISIRLCDAPGGHFMRDFIPVLLKYGDIGLAPAAVCGRAAPQRPDDDEQADSQQHAGTGQKHNHECRSSYSLSASRRASRASSTVTGGDASPLRRRSSKAPISK